MKIQNKPVKPAKSGYTFFRQIVQYFPQGMMERIAKESKADIRKFLCTSYVIDIMYGHIIKARSLNEICDGLRLHASDRMKIKNATLLKRNTFSNATHTRDPAIAEQKFDPPTEAALRSVDISVNFPLEAPKLYMPQFFFFSNS